MIWVGGSGGGHRRGGRQASRLFVMSFDLDPARLATSDEVRRIGPSGPCAADPVEK